MDAPVAPAHAVPGVPFDKGADHRRFGGGRSPTPRVLAPDGTKKTLAEIAREGTWDAVQVLRECVNDPHEDMATRIRAAGYLLSLGWGAAPKEATLRLVGNNTLSAMSDAELIAHALKKTAALPITIDVATDTPAD